MARGSAQPNTEQPDNATESTAAPTTDATPTSAPPQTKRARQTRPRPRTRAPNTPPPPLPHHTLSHPPWCYMHLTSPSSHAPPPDELTAYLDLSAALKRFLGQHGAAIPLDMLAQRGRSLYVRVPGGDRRAVLAAVGEAGEAGWRVQGWSHWSAVAAGREAGQDLFQSHK